LRVDDVTAVLELDPALPPLWADPHQLHQVVVNLVTNAHQAMRQSAPPRAITLATRLDPARGRVVLTVADTGPGIPPPIRQRIFEPFFTTKPPGHGTGLGLSLCQGIVEQHRGTIEVESPPGRGAVFRIELPVEAPPAESEAAAEAELPPIEGRTILLVDDEPDVAALLADLLAEDHHQVDVAHHGAAALGRLTRRAYDLILSDLRMPELDGPGL
jgi:anti-sigma regulatory factor (Ser/Thr protein kinase)